MNFYKKLLQFIDQPFKEGGIGPGGYDCLGLIGRVQESLGKEFPHSFEDIDEQNYSELYKADRVGAEEKLIQFLTSFCKEIPTSAMKPGDIILVKSHKNGFRFPGIYVGNMNYITSFSDAGVKVFPLASDKVELLKAWRL
jgi:cell wall-associated NlpC family hydrolase